MRYLYILALIPLLLSCHAKSKIKHVQASSELAAQIKDVLEDAPTEFISFKGEKLEETADVIMYASTLTLEGTTRNSLLKNEGKMVYMALIGETLHMDEAKEWLEEWKAKLVPLLGVLYDTIPYKRTKGEFLLEGYYFSSPSRSLLLESSYKEEVGVYQVSLTFVNDLKPRITK